MSEENTNLSEEEKEELGLNDAGNSTDPDPKPAEPVVEAEKTLQELKEEALSLGMAEDSLKGFTTKSSLLTTIQLLRQMKVVQAKGQDNAPADVEIDVDDPATKDRKVVQEDGTVVVKKAVRDNERTDRTVYETRKQRIKRLLDSQPKVKVFVPRDFGEKAGAALPVTINGYTYSVLKGMMVEVPQGVYEVIQNSLEETEKAGTEFLMGRKKYDESLGQTVTVSDRL